MAIDFPTSLDDFTNPSADDKVDGSTTAGTDHAVQHGNINDAIEALQAKVGADSSAVTSSHDYKIAQLEAAGAGAYAVHAEQSITTSVDAVDFTDIPEGDFFEVHFWCEWGGAETLAFQINDNATAGDYHWQMIAGYNNGDYNLEDINDKAQKCNYFAGQSAAGKIKFFANEQMGTYNGIDYIIECTVGSSAGTLGIYYFGGTLTNETSITKLSFGTYTFLSSGSGGFQLTDGEFKLIKVA